MLFTSWNFAVFLPLVFLLHYASRSLVWQVGILTIASFVFYGWTAPWLTLLLAASTDAKSLLDVPDTAPDALCRPPVHIGVAHGLCLETRPNAFGDPATLPAGAVRAKRPFWLPIARANRAQQERMLEVLAFARRMSALGFELTSLTGFVEIPGGVEITGRSGEKEIVALVVSQSPPYVHPITDGPAWTLAGEPQIIQLPAGKSVKLKATPPYAGPKIGRETIIWRR